MGAFEESSGAKGMQEKRKEVRCSSCMKPVDDHYFTLGVLVCPETVRRVMKIRRSYRLQVILVVLLTILLPYLVGRLHPEGEQR